MRTDAVVVIGTYNEAETIGTILEALSDFRVVVVDSESPDGTAQIAERYPNAWVDVRRNQGIAAAYWNGLWAALTTTAEYIVQMDAGLTHDPADVPALVFTAQRRHSDLTIGSRFVGAFPYRSYRTMISLAAGWLMRRRGVNVLDATSGFRCWQHNTLRRALVRGMRARGFAFQLELLWNAHRIGARIDEYPIPYRLTNSSFRPSMLAEALQTVWRLA